MSVTLSFQRRGLPADIRSVGARQDYDVTFVSRSFPRGLTHVCNDGRILKLLPSDRLDHRLPNCAGPEAPQIVLRLIELEAVRYLTATAYVALPEVEAVVATRPTLDMATYALPIDVIGRSVELEQAIEDHAIALEHGLYAALYSGRPTNSERRKEHQDVELDVADRRTPEQYRDLALAQLLADGASRQARESATKADGVSPLLTYLAVAIRIFLDADAVGVFSTDAGDPDPVPIAVAAYGDWRNDGRFTVWFRPPDEMQSARIAASSTIRRALKRRPPSDASPYRSAKHTSTSIAASEADSQLPSTLTADSSSRSSSASAASALKAAGSDPRGARRPPERRDLQVAHACAIALYRTLQLQFDSDDAHLIDAALDRVDCLLADITDIENALGQERPG